MFRCSFLIAIGEQAITRQPRGLLESKSWHPAIGGMHQWVKSSLTPRQVLLPLLGRIILAVACTDTSVLSIMQMVGHT